MTRRFAARTAAAIAAGAVLLALSPRSALAQQGNAGDIPDSQVFVAYRSPLGYTLKVPEGWARSASASEVRFVDHYDAVSVRLASAAAAPTPDGARRDQAAALQGGGAKVGKVAAIDLPAGLAVMLAYQSESAANPVTGKSVPLENEQYLFWHDGRLATLTLSAPLGADNVDQWRLMSRSFRWN